MSVNSYDDLVAQLCKTYPGAADHLRDLEVRIGRPYAELASLTAEERSRVLNTTLKGSVALTYLTKHYMTSISSVKTEPLPHLSSIRGCGPATAEAPVLAMLSTIGRLRREILSDDLDYPSTVSVEEATHTLDFTRILLMLEMHKTVDAKDFFEELELRYDAVTSNMHDVMTNILGSMQHTKPHVYTMFMTAPATLGLDLHLAPGDGPGSFVAAVKDVQIVAPPQVLVLHGMSTVSGPLTIPDSLDVSGTVYHLHGVVYAAPGRHAHLRDQFGFYVRDPMDRGMWVRYVAGAPERASKEDVDNVSRAHGVCYLRADAEADLLTGPNPTPDVTLLDRVECWQEEMLRAAAAKAGPEKCVALTFVVPGDVVEFVPTAYRGLARKTITQVVVSLPKTAKGSEVLRTAAKVSGLPSRGIQVWRCDIVRDMVTPRSLLGSTTTLDNAFYKVGTNHKEGEAWEGTLLVAPVWEGGPAAGRVLVFLKWFDATNHTFSFLGVGTVSNTQTVEALEHDVLTRIGATHYQRLVAEKELPSGGHAAVDLADDPALASLVDGDTIVWMYASAQTTAGGYAKFHENKVTVRILCTNTEEELGRLALLKDMTYQVVQTHVAEILKVDPLKIRLVVQDPLTSSPDLASIKNKAASGYKLESLLSTASGPVDCLYVEVGSEKVTVLDTMDSFCYTALDEKLNPIVKGVRRAYCPKRITTNKDIATLVRAAIPSLPRFRVILSTKSAIDDVVFSEADLSSESRAQVSTMYVYRVEPIPARITPDVPQTSLDFAFFYFSGHHVERRGDPFSMFVANDDTKEGVVERLRQRFGFTRTDLTLYTLPFNVQYYPPVVIAGGDRVVEALKDAHGYKVHVGIEVGKGGALF